MLSAKASIWSDRPARAGSSCSSSTSVVIRRALGHDGAVGVEQLAAVDGEPVALVDCGEHVLADVVDQRDAGLEQDAGPEVRDSGPRPTARR